MQKKIAIFLLLLVFSQLSAHARGPELTALVESAAGRFLLTETSEGSRFVMSVMGRKLGAAEDWRIFLKRLEEPRFTRAAEQLEISLGRIEKKYSKPFGSSGFRGPSATISKAQASLLSVLGTNEFAGVSFFKLGEPNSYTVAKNEFLYSRDVLDTLIREPEFDQFIGTFEPWKQLRAPFFGHRPRGIENLRKLANEKGVVVVVQGQRPQDPAKLAEDEFRNGAKLVYAGDLFPGQIIHGEGLVLHPGNPVELGNVFRGAANPHLGYGFLHGNLSKWNEYLFADAVMPGIMAESFKASSLSYMSKELDGLRAKLLRGALSLNQIEITNLKQKLRNLFGAIDAKFPEGAFLKQIDEAATADYGGQITTFKSKPDVMVEQYVDALEKIRVNKGPLKADSAEFAEALEDFEKQEIEFVQKFLFSPQNIMIQKKLSLATTPLGQPMEFRVDFVDGEAVRIISRHTTEYLPEQAGAAAAALTQFFKKAPREFRYLSGGADVAFTTDGRPVIIEFNFGAESWFIMAEYDPVMANIYLSNLLGKQTPLMSTLEKAIQRPVREQGEFLFQIGEKYSGESLQTASQWLMNRYLDAWLLKPTAKNARRLLKSLDSIYRHANLAAEETEKLLKSARSFIETRGIRV